MSLHKGVILLMFCAHHIQLTSLTGVSGSRDYSWGKEAVRRAMHSQDWRFISFSYPCGILNTAIVIPGKLSPHTSGPCVLTVHVSFYSFTRCSSKVDICGASMCLNMCLCVDNRPITGTDSEELQEVQRRLLALIQKDHPDLMYPDSLCTLADLKEVGYILTNPLITNAAQSTLQHQLDCDRIGASSDGKVDLTVIFFTKFWTCSLSNNSITVPRSTLFSPAVVLVVLSVSLVQQRKPVFLNSVLVL